MNPEEPEAPKAPKRYTEEFKHSVVDHWMSRGKTAVTVAKESGVPAWNLRDWKRAYHSVARPVDAKLQWRRGIGRWQCLFDRWTSHLRSHDEPVWQLTVPSRWEA